MTSDVSLPSLPVVCVRLSTLEERQREDRDEIRSMKNWIMGTLAAACGGLIVQVLTLLKR